MNNHSGNARVMSTANTVAKGRTFTDIPYCAEIFEEMKSLSIVDENPVENTYIDLAPRFEARYKMINLLLGENAEINQILEIASGLTPRGLQFTERQDIQYVEMDWAPTIETKKRILTSIFHKKNEEFRKNLHLSVGDVLDSESVDKATSFFDTGKPIAVINEGLFRYLSLPEKQTLAKNIASALKKFGGVWITPDITIIRDLSKDPAESERVEKFEQITGINMNENNFKSVEDAQQFFESCGFTVDRRLFNEVTNSLVSPTRLGLNEESIKERVGRSVAFVMKVKL